MTRPPATVRNRRQHLLSRSALAGLGIAVAIGAAPALAQVTGVGIVTSTASNGGAVGVASGGGVTDVTLGAGRSIVNWANLDVTAADTLNFHFDNRGDIVLNRVTGSASIDGVVNGCMATCSTTGGNVWVLSSGGVMIGANARINTGGFLATTGGLVDTDFLDGDMNFAFTGAPTNSTISVASGAQITTHGGSLALIAPIVTTAAGSTLTGANGGDVVYGSAENYNVTFAPTGADDLDLITFQVPSQSDGSAGTPGLTLNGTTNANQVFAAIVSKSSVASSILLGGNITATTASGENGDIVLSAGAGFTNGVADTPMGFDASITQNTTSTLTANNVTMRASDNIAVDEVNATGRVWLNSEWASISQTGTITANILRAEAGGDVILTNTGNDFNFLSYIESQGLGGIDIVDANGFVINDYIFHLGGGARTASLTALTGSISQTGGAIQVGTLNVSAAGGSINLGVAANNSANLGTITAGAGDFSYRSLLDVNLAGPITANNVTLSSIAGGITQSAGAITTNQLSARAATGISLNRVGNQIGEITGLSSTSGDIYLLSNGNLSLTGDVTGSASVTLEVFSGGITQNSGIITAGAFSASAGGGLSLGGENEVAQLGALTAGGTGDIVFRNAGALVLTGAISAAGDDVTLYSTSGAITQSSGAITADRLTASATGNITLYDGVNNVATIGGLASVNGDIVYRDLDGFDIQGDITANSSPFRGVMLASSGAGGVTQTSGVLDVGYFRGVTGGSITLGGTNQIRRLISTVIGNGALTLNTTTDLSVDGTVSANTVSLTSTGAITQVTNAQIWTNTLNASAVTGINLTASGFGANNISNLGVISNTTSGGVTIGNAMPNLNLTGNVTASGQAVSISNSMGGIYQTGGIITADALTASAADGLSLNRVNSVTTLGNLTAGGTGDVIYRNSGDLALTGSITSGTGGQVMIASDNGAINQNAGAISADWIKFYAGTTISQGVGATLTSTALSLTSGGATSLGQANNFGRLYDLHVGGDLTLRNSGSIDLSPVLSGYYSSGGALTLTSDTGGIVSATAGINTSRLTASAAGSISLAGTIASLGDVTAGNGILLTTYNGAMELTGDVTGRSVSLYAETTLTQTAGKIDAERFNALANGAISLTGANEIDLVGRLDTDRYDLGVGRDITLRNTGAIVLDYLVKAAGANVSLTSDTGGISQTGFSVITANQITASAGAGDITLDQSANSIAAIGGLATTNGGISLSTTTGLSLGGAITATGDVSLRADGGHLLQSAGSITADKLSLYATGTISLGQNFVSKLGRISAGGDFVTDSAGMSSGVLELTDDITAGGMVVLHNPGGINQTGGAITAGSLVLNAGSSNLTASGANQVTTLTELIGNDVTYNSTNDLTLRLTAAGSASITTGGSLSFSGFSPSSVGGVLNLDAATGISQTRALSAGSFGTIINRTSGGVVLTNVNGAINLAGNVTASGQTVSLRSNTGQIEQTGGVITANVLNLQAAGRIWANNANAVTSFGAVTAGGHVLLRNASNTVVGGDITASGFDVTLRSNNGSITQTAGSDITSNSLQVIAQSGINLTNAGNAINQLAWAQTASGGFAFSQTNGFQISGPVLAGGQTVSLTSLNGAITQTSGTLNASWLNASAAGTLTLNQGNDVDRLGVISTGGSFLFRDVTGFDLTTDVTAANQVVLLAQNGSIRQISGAITANDINAMASVDLLLIAANQINTISALSAGNDLFYRQVGDLSVPTISAAGTVSLYSAGNITQTGTITADTLVLGAGHDITLGRNFVSKLGRIEAFGGDFNASDPGGLSSGALELTGDISVGGTMTLVNPGAITQSGGAITAPNLILTTAGALTATGSNAVLQKTRLSALNATFNAVGNLTIQVNTTGAASITSTGAVRIDGVGASTGDTLSIQAANGISKGAQDLAFTKFGDLTNTTTGGVNLTNSYGMELNGNITAAGQTVTLSSPTGGIVQNGGVITAGRLNVSAAQTLFFNSINQVGALGAINVANGGFSFRNDGDLLLDGAVNATSSVLLNSVGGAVTQTAGSDISAAGLYVEAQNGITLTNAGNNVSKLMTVMNHGAGGIAYSQANGFQIDGLIRARSQAVNLTSMGGGISETGNTFVQIEAGMLNLSANGAIALTRDNDIDNLGAVTAGGGFTFNDVNGFNLIGAVNAGAVVLEARAGSINQAAGVITATSIDAGASGDLLLGGNNVVTTVTDLAAGNNLLYRQVGDLSVPAISAGGALSLYSTTGSISQTGILSAATLNAGAATGITLNNSGNIFGTLGNLSSTTGNISVYEADGFNLTGAITTSNTQLVSLVAVNGPITQQAGATIQAGTLELVASGGATLNGDNDIDNLGTITAGPSFTFNDIDGFDIVGTLSATTANLRAGGAITQSTGVLGVGTLSLAAASATLAGANNINNLGDVNVTGALTYRNLDTFTLSGAITVGGTLNLTSTNDTIDQLAGSTLNVGRLEASGRWDVRFSRSGNVIGQLGDITSARGNISILGSGPMTIDGNLSAAGSGQSVAITSADSGVTMTAAGSITAGGDTYLRSNGGNIVMGATSAGGTLYVTAIGGSISSTAAPAIVANRLAAYAANDIVLTGSNIDINQFGLVAAGGALSITGNNGPLDLNDNVIARTVALATTGAITQSGGIISTDTASISSGASSLTLGRANNIGTVSLNGADINFTSAGSFAANVVTASGAVSLTATTGKITQTALTGKIVAGSLTATAATGLEFFGGHNDITTLAGLSSTNGAVTYRDMGGFNIAGNIAAAGQTVTLVSDGAGVGGSAITQSGGAITAGRLDGTSAGDLLFTQANTVSSVGLLNAGGDLTYRGAGSLTLTQNITAADTLNLVSDSGAIVQNGGVIIAGSLAASAVTGVQLVRLNDIDHLGAITVTTGGFTFRDTDGFDITGAVQGSDVTLQAVNDITQTTGSLTTGALSVFTNGQVRLDGPGNDIGSLGLSTALGGLIFVNADGFTLDGNIVAGPTLNLTATTGSIVQNSGVITAGTLHASASGDISLAGANVVDMLGNVGAGGDFTFNDTDGFTLKGAIGGDAIRLTTVDGEITQTGGAITGDSLYASAATGVTLSRTTNNVATLAGLINTTSGGISYSDAGSVDITGAVSALGQAVTFNVGGDLTQSGAGVITASRVQGSAGGAFALGDLANNVGQVGPVNANRIAFASSGGLNIIGNLTATNGVELKANTGITQSVGAVITGTTLSAQANGDIILDQGNDLDSIIQLKSLSGNITYVDLDGFSLDPASYGDIWTTGTLTLKAGPTGGISQTHAGLRAGTLAVSAGQDIVLGQQNHIDVLGASSAGGAVFTVVNSGDLQITGDVSVTDAAGVISLTSTNGDIDQTAGRIDASVVEGSAAGDYKLTRFTGAVGNIASTAGDIDIGNAGDITLRGLLKTGAANSVTLTSGGGIGQGVGRIEAGTLNLSAGTVITLDGAQGNDINRLGTVSALSSFAFVDDNDFDLIGDIDVSAAGGHVGLRSNGGAITQSGGVVTVDSLNLEAATGLDLTGANKVNQVTLANGATGTVAFTNAKALTLLDATSTGDVIIKTTTGLLTSGDVTTSGLISLAGAGGVFSEGVLSTNGDVAVSASAGDIEVRNIRAGDDVTVTADSGQAQVWNLTLTGASDGEGTGQNVAISASGNALLGARDEAGIGLLYPSSLTRSGGAGTISVTSIGGNAGVFLSSIGDKIDTLTAGGVTGTATIVADTGNILAGTVTGHNVALKATSGDVDPDAVSIGGGDYTLTGRDFLSGAFGFTGAARDILITDTAGALTLNANVTAQRNLTINAVGDIVDGTGTTALIAGADMTGQGNLTLNATGIAINTIGADGDVSLDAGTGLIDVHTLVVKNDYNLSGGSFSTGALSPIGATAGTWTITGTGPGDFDFTGRMLTYNGDIQINAAHAIIGGSAQSIFGSLRIDGGSHVDVEGLYAARDITVIADAALTVDSATAYGGNISLAGRTAIVEGFTQASGNVLVAATNGATDVGAATAGGDITVTATNGGAWLGSASLTGATGDVTVSATGGDAILGAVDYASITTDNALTRAAGSAGTVKVTASGGDAGVYLDHADTALTLVKGDNVDVTVATGSATLGTLTALTGDAYAQTLDGGLTIGNATAQGDVGLHALSGDAYVDFADAGGHLQVSAIAGNATLRGAESGSMIAVVAAQTATFGADSKSLITSANYANSGPCGCAGGGIVVVSTSGDAVVNLDNAVGVFSGISAVRGDVNVNLRTGNLTIGELSGRNITVEVAAGSIETGADHSSIGAQVTGGSYSITARDFLGNVLNPLLQDEFGAPTTLQNYTIVDTLGDLDMSGRSIAAQGDIRIDVRDGALTGNVRLTSNGGVTMTAEAIQADTLHAGGDVNLDASAGGVTVASVTAKDAISITTVGGDAVLGEAHLLGTGANQLLVSATGAGRKAVLGSALASGVTAANVFTSAGSTTRAEVTSAGGDAFVHLDTSDALTSVSAARDVGIVVRTGDFAVGAINAVGGRVDVQGPTGGLTIGRLDAHTDARVFGNDVTLTNGLLGGDLTIDADGDIAFAGPNGRIDVTGEASLTAGRGITQASNTGLKAAGLTIDAGDAVSLGGVNDIAVIRAVDVATGGFAYRSVRVGGIDIVGAINAAGQTVDLRTANGGLSQSGAGVIVAQRLTGSSDDGVNLRADNRIAELGDFTSTGHDVFLNVGQALSIVGTVDSAKALTIQSDAMTIAATGTVRSSASGDAVLLASNGVFTNQSGADAVQASNGRWLIYTQAFNDASGSTVGDAYGGLSGKSYYGTSYDFDGGFGGQINAGNRFVHAYQPVLTATPVSQTVTYNGQVPILTATIQGLVNGDTAADAWAGSALITGASGKTVGTYSLTASLGSLLSDLNYAFAFGTGTLVIDPKTLTGTVNAQNKAYDGTISATGSITLTGVVTGDDVSAAATSYGFGDKNAGANKVVTASGAALSGDDAGNYRLDPLATALADILRRNISAVVTANGKTYDATTAATGSLALDGVLTGDDLSITGDLLFADKNAGLSKVVSVANAQISGIDAGNYDVTVGTDFADIARKVLTGTFIANDKTYDGMTAATGTLTLNGVIVGDDASANATYSFADKNAGVDKIVTASATLAGTDANNYEIAPLATALADIQRKRVTVSITVNSKVYDGTVAATAAMSVNGVIAGDDASVATGSYSFADANAGTGKTVAISGVALTGSGSSNYELANVPSTLLADILRRQVSIGADDKTKLFGQIDPALTYRITAGSLVTGEGFTGDLARETGESFGGYAIGQGSLALGANYEILFTPGVLNIRPVPGGGQDGGDAFKYLSQPKSYDLNWNPTLNFTYDREPICISASGCAPG